jgi:hypothetical protein
MLDDESISFGQIWPFFHEKKPLMSCAHRIFTCRQLNEFGGAFYLGLIKSHVSLD